MFNKEQKEHLIWLLETQKQRRKPESWCGGSIKWLNTECGNRAQRIEDEIKELILNDRE